MARRSHSDLTVAIIHFQTPRLLERCLLAVRAAAPEARLLVVDTGETRPLEPGWQQEHPGVELLREPNHSYAGAVNAALRRTLTPRFAQLNADALPAPGSFDDLAEALEESGAAMVGPLARDGTGKLQRNGVPYRWYQWRASSRGWDWVPWLSGCMQYLRMEAVSRVGGMDSRYRFYNEDMEWCFRLRAAGERCALVGSEIVHLGGASTPKSAEPLIEGLRGGYLLTRRYRGPLVRRLHRAALLAASAALALLAVEPERRRAYRDVAAMMWRDQVDESPYGDSLGTANPLFARGGARS